MQNAQERALVSLAIQRGLLTPGGLARAQQGRPPGEALASALVRVGALAQQAAGGLLHELSNRSFPCASCRRVVGWDELRGLSVLACPTCGRALSAGDPGLGSATGSAPAQRRPHSSLGLIEAEPQPGQRLGQHELLEELGRGSNGVVFLARRPGVEHPYAVKVLKDADQADEETVARFQLEAAVGQKLDHPDIVAVHDFGQHGPHLYYAMDYVKGPTLKERLREGALEAVDAAVLMGRLARTVGAAHEAGVIHRDLKPANVVLEERSGRPKIMDFGLARDRSLLRSMTQSGDVIGTPYYMSPEQFRGQRDLDHRADIYALGVILYECLCGQRPYTATSAMELAEKVIRGDPPPPSARLESVSPGLEAVCLKAMAVDPDDRYPSAEALRNALEEVLREELIAPERRGRGAAPLVALAVLALGVTAAGLMLAWPTGTQPATRPQDEAPTPAGDPLDAARAALRAAVAAGRPAPYPEVRAAFEQAAATGEPLARLELATYLIHRGRQQDALRLLDGLGQGPARLPALYLRGRAEEELGRLARAREAWTRLQAQDPSGAWGRVGQAALQRLDGELGEAAAAAKAAAAHEETRAPALLELGRALAGGDDAARQEADQALAQLEALVPDDPAPQLVLARLHLSQAKKEELDQAAAALERAFDLSTPFTPREALTLRARLLQRRGDLEGALADCEQALGLDPDAVDALLIRGLVHDGLDDPQAAQADWARAREVDADAFQRALERLSPAERKRVRGELEGDTSAPASAGARLPWGKITRALRDRLQVRVADVEPTPARELLLEAELASASGQPWSEVSPVLQRAGALAPDSPTMRREQVVLFLGRGRGADALDLIADARRRGWGSPELDVLAAEASWRAGDVGKAALSLRSLAHGEGVPALRAALDLALLEGDEPGAMKAADTLLSRAPLHPLGLLARALLLCTAGKLDDAALAAARAYDVQGLIDLRLLAYVQLRQYGRLQGGSAPDLGGILSDLNSAATAAVGVEPDPHVDLLGADFISRLEGNAIAMVRGMLPGLLQPDGHTYYWLVKARLETASANGQAFESWRKVQELAPELGIPGPDRARLRQAFGKDARLAKLLGEQ